MVDDFTFGAIAQLGERLTGSQEVGGSSPPGSTTRSASATAALGAEECRLHFGRYIERASRGESFEIARRAKAV